MIGLDDLCLATGGQLYGEATARAFTGICADPARVMPGDLFVVSSLPETGQNADIAQALAAGATGLLCETPPTQDVAGMTAILVGDARLALEQWATFHLRQFHPLTIGVIGSIGKTQVCAAVAAFLGARYPVYASTRSHQGPFQLALDVSGLEQQHAYAIFEMSPDAYTSLGDMMSLLQPQVLVISNPTSKPSRGSPRYEVPDAIAQAISRLPTGGAVIASATDREFFERSKPDHVRLVTYNNGAPANSQAPLADITASQPVFTLDGFGLNLRIAKETFSNIRTQGIGFPAVDAFLSALAVCAALDFPIKDVLAGLATVQPEGPRVGQNADGVYLLDASASGRPETGLALLEWADQIGEQARRRVLILGDFEPVDDRLVELCSDIGWRASASVDAIVSLDPSSASAVSAARRAGMATQITFLPHEKSEAAAFLRSNLAAGDLIVVIGRRKASTEAFVRKIESSETSTGHAGSVPPERVEPHAERLALSWLEIDLQAVESNTSQVKRQLRGGVSLMAVVKDDGFRHGLQEIVRATLRGGADMLAVETLDAGLEVRAAGIDAPVLVMGYISLAGIEKAVAADLALSIQGKAYAGLVARASRRLKMRARCHIRVNITGRDAGVPVGEVVALVREIKKADQLTLEGLFTEFSPAPGAAWTADSTRQMGQFTQISRNLAAAGVEIPYVHAAGSAAMLSIRDSVLSTARIGHLLYGISPFPTIKLPDGLRPALSWKTTVVDLVVDAPRGDPHKSGRRLAVLPVGCRDGLYKQNRAQASALVGGIRVPFTETFGADWAWLDVTSAPSAVIGSEVVLLGAQGRERITVEEVAAQRGCASYDVIAALPDGLHREYVDGGL